MGLDFIYIIQTASENRAYTASFISGQLLLGGQSETVLVFYLGNHLGRKGYWQLTRQAASLPPAVSLTDWNSLAYVLYTCLLCSD